MASLRSMGQRKRCVAYILHHFQSSNSAPSGSDVIHFDVLGSHVVVLHSIKAANELLDKRSSIYSDRSVNRCRRLFLSAIDAVV